METDSGNNYNIYVHDHGGPTPAAAKTTPGRGVFERLKNSRPLVWAAVAAGSLSLNALDAGRAEASHTGERVLQEDFANVECGDDGNAVLYSTVTPTDEAIIRTFVATPEGDQEVYRHHRIDHLRYTAEIPWTEFNGGTAGVHTYNSAEFADGSVDTGVFRSFDNPCTGEPAPPIGGGPIPVPAPIAEACPSGEVPPSGFVDTNGNVHRQAIDCIAWYDITRGVTATEYNPSGYVTRGQMASFIARTVDLTHTELPASGNQHFSDTEGNVHADNINRLAAAGMVDGIGDGTYRPNRPVRRDQMAKFVVETYQYVTATDLPVSRDHFSDDNGNIHEHNINQAAEAGITTGTGNGNYSPSATVRRDQMGSFIARTLNHFVRDGHASTPAG